MIVDGALYTDGKREPVGMAEALARARRVPDSFVWLGLKEPTFDEFDDLALYFAPHPLAIEDAVHAHQRPKLDVYDECLFVVLKTLCYDEQRAEIDSGEIMLFTGENFMVTVQHGTSDVLVPVRRRLELAAQRRVVRPWTCPNRRCPPAGRRTLSPTDPCATARGQLVKAVPPGRS